MLPNINTRKLPPLQTDFQTIYQIFCHHLMLDAHVRSKLCTLKSELSSWRTRVYTPLTGWGVLGASPDEKWHIAPISQITIVVFCYSHWPAADVDSAGAGVAVTIAGNHGDDDHDGDAASGAAIILYFDHSYFAVWLDVVTTAARALKYQLQSVWPAAIVCRQCSSNGCHWTLKLLGHCFFSVLSLSFSLRCF